MYTEYHFFHRISHHIIRCWCSAFGPSTKYIGKLPSWTSLRLPGTTVIESKTLTRILERATRQPMCKGMIRKNKVTSKFASDCYGIVRSGAYSEVNFWNHATSSTKRSDLGSLVQPYPVWMHLTWHPKQYLCLNSTKTVPWQSRQTWCDEWSCYRLRCNRHDWYETSVHSLTSGFLANALCSKNRTHQQQGWNPTPIQQHFPSTHGQHLGAPMSWKIR